MLDYQVVNDSKSQQAGLNTISPTVIKVVGCGGCGGNALDCMIDAKLGGVDFIALNTDLQALAKCKAENKIQIGQKVAGGLGAGGKPEVGEEAAREEEETIRKLLKDADMVFVTAGMGGGTGTGSAPVVAKIAREIGALTVAVVTTPFKFEGRVRMSHADEGVRKLRAEVDSLIAIPNELILADEGKKLSVPRAFELITDILRQGVQGISDIITKPGLVNRDFRDVESVMKGQGDALLGVGVGEGDNRAVDAAMAAINNRLLVDTHIDGAKNVLINICGNSEVGIGECNEIASVITASAHPDATVLWGQVLDETMDDKISVTVIATGFDSPVNEDVGSVIDKNISIKKADDNYISDGEFIKISNPKTEEPKKPEGIPGLFDSSELYEDPVKPVAVIKQPVEESPAQPAPVTPQYTSAPVRTPVQQTVPQPEHFNNIDVNDIKQPAYLRKKALEGLPRGITIGKR